MRGIYNTGKKGILFAELSPFITQDAGYNYTRTYRFATTFLYDYSATDYLSLRVGYMRSFLLGNRYLLPYFGIRVGKLNKTNLSLQFPRSLTLNIPIGQYIQTHLYVKSQGGVYSFANSDSLMIGNTYERLLYFGRHELLSGLRVDAQPCRFLNFIRQISNN